MVLMYLVHHTHIQSTVIQLTIGHKFLPKAFVCYDPCLWEASDGTVHLNVYISFVCMFQKIVLLDGPTWELIKGDAHVLKVFKGGSEVYILC
jgi:hypothetical protein